MPRGTSHDLIGLLLREGCSLIMRVDDGGEWRLDAPGRASRLVGRRVRVTGTRDGFDLLGVTHIAAVGHTGAIASADPSSRLRISALRVVRRFMSILFFNRSQR